jgi:hypothetical protein
MIKQHMNWKSIFSPGYSDNNLKLNLDVALANVFEPEISFSLSKGGSDHLLKFSNLMPQNQTKNEINAFRACHEEILIMVADRGLLIQLMKIKSEISEFQHIT